jgi:arsenite methyltransferase
MPKLAFVPIILRELLCKRTLPREPEPDLVMADEQQVKAYSLAGRIDGVMSAAYIFHSAHASSVIRGSRRIVDLGCGPATQLAQIASFNSDSEFIGIDLSSTMLDSAREHIKSCGLHNVSFSQGDITNLSHLDDQSVDAVISTMALHHLPTEEHLSACFREISRVLKPGGAVYLTDFCRLKSLKSVLPFAYMNADRQPHIFSLDYERSLRAAFLHEDFVDNAGKHLPGSVNVYSTFLVPLLAVIRTAPREITSDLGLKLKQFRKDLPLRYRRDLDDLRLFFKHGGLAGDPFKAS